MTEQTDAPQGGAEGVATPEAVDTATQQIADDTTAQDTGTDDEAGQADETSEKPKRKPWWENRFDELTAKRYEAERRAAYLEGQLQSLSKTEQVKPEVVPTLEQFNYDESAYTHALSEHYRKQAETAIDQKLTQREREAAESQKTYTALTKLKEGGAKHADFTAAVSDIAATEAVRDFVLGTANAADVLYDLGRDQAATERFNNLSPVQQAIELGRRAATPQATTRTIPPPPPLTVGGTASGAQKSPDQMSMAEYAKWVAERDK